MNLFVSPEHKNKIVLERFMKMIPAIGAVIRCYSLHCMKWLLMLNLSIHKRVRLTRDQLSRRTVLFHFVPFVGGFEICIGGFDRRRSLFRFSERFEIRIIKLF